MARVIRTMTALVAAALLASACTIEPSDLEETEERYLTRLTEALEPMRQNAEAFEKVFQETTSHDRFVSDLKNLRAIRRLARTGRAVQRMRPPPRFARDHRRLLEALVDMAPVAQSADRLAQREELVPSAAQHARAVVIYHRSLLGYSPRFCVVAAASAAERDLCDPLGILPGAAYGERLHAALAEGSAEFTPRGFLFVSRAFFNEEVAEYLRSVGPDLLKGLRTARNGIRELVPTDEFAADHRVIEEYFLGITEVSEEIVQAANSNPPRLRALFPQSQRLVDRARERLSEDIRPAVAVWFFPSSDEE